MRVLILRPEPGNAATVSAVQEMGHEPLSCPLFEVVPIDWTAQTPAAFDSVVMTSANAARNGGPRLADYTDLPITVVGSATAAAARAAGFTDITDGDGDAGALGPLLTGRVLHLAGENYRPLEAAAEVVTVPVYVSRVVAMTALPLSDIVLIHSARAGQRAAELITDRASTRLVAISRAAAAAAGPGWAHTDVAGHPDEATLLATLARVCETGAMTASQNQS